MRLKNLILILAALTTVVVLAACGSSGQSEGDQGNAQEQRVPDKQIAPKMGKEKNDAGAPVAVKPPADKTLKLTVPKMARIKNDTVPTGIGTDMSLFRDYAAVHLKATGYPWEEEANVYLAGHRLGFKQTDSWLAFDDLNELEKGDEILVEDANGRQYTYEVFKKFVTGPRNVSVLNTVEGKNIVTLQTCTLPDYTNRLLVRGELKDIKEA